MQLVGYPLALSEHPPNPVLLYSYFQQHAMPSRPSLAGEPSNVARARSTPFDHCSQLTISHDPLVYDFGK